jgi:hypothetical protein
MKLQNDLVKLIIFIIATGILTRCMEYYINMSHATMASIISGTIIQIFGVYLAYRVILK